MKKYNIFLLAILALLSLNSCEDYFDTRPASDLSADEVFNDITRAQQFLYQGYRYLPSRPNIAFDYFSDNQVQNNNNNDRYSIGWTNEYSPNSGVWSNSLYVINHLNQYLRDGFKVPYTLLVPATSKELRLRMRGEAFGLRAYNEWLLMKNYAGPSAKNPSEFLSYPVFTNVIDQDVANTIPRATYKKGFDQIMADIDSAYTYVKWRRYNGTLSYNDNSNTGRVSQEMLLALKARVYLYASSEAFKQIPAQTAADTIYAIVKRIDGTSLKTLKAFSDRFNDTDNIDDFWRSQFASSGDLESTHYASTMYGTGQCNPSQQLVDAFADKDGFPLVESTVYNPQDPYINRDMRLLRYIFVNGPNSFRNATIESFTGGLDDNGMMRIYGTRTGYFMKRFLSSAVDRTPRTSNATADNKFCVLFSRAGLYLDFAEAAVEAYGVAGKNAAWSFSAVDAIEKIRIKGGLSATADKYLRPVAAKDLVKLKELVRNERRIETSFEGERLYDMMRWKLPADQMSKSVMGVTITKNTDGKFAYDYTRVANNRVFESRMYYFPIPRVEILKSSALEQNAGWE